MGLIVNAINRLGRFKTDVITSRIQNDNTVNEIKLEQYRNAIKQLEVKDEVNKLELDIKYQNKLRRKSFLYNIISIVGTAGSIALTLCGITGSSFWELFSTSKNIAYSSLVIFTQFSVWVVSANKHYIKEKFYQNYNKLRILQVFTVFTSVICNYMFLVSFLKPQNTLNYAFISMMSVSVDLISLTFCSLAQDCKFRNYTYKFGKDLDDNVGLFTMIRFIMTYKLKSKIKLKYLTELNEYNAKFAQFEQKNKKPKSIGSSSTHSHIQPSNANVNYPNSVAASIGKKHTTNVPMSYQTENVSASANTPLSTYVPGKKYSISNSASTNNKLKSDSTSMDNDDLSDQKKSKTTTKNSSKVESDILNDNTKDNIDLYNNSDKITKKDTKNNNTDNKVLKDTKKSNKEVVLKETKPSDATANVLNFPNYKNQTLKEYGMYETVKERLSSLEDDTMLSASKLAINTAEWKKIKERLIREDLAYEQNSRLRKKGDHHLDRVKKS